MQTHANSAAFGINLGPLDNTALAAEIRRLLGNDINLSYTQPQLAGGVRTSAKDYAIFLKKLLNNQLKMAALLGTNPVCTNPSTCTNAVSTPITTGANWHYSMGHWVEDDLSTGDGAFSSTGAFGFYPWLDASKTYYGIVARFDVAGSGNESAQCGARIRKAWITGVVQ
jgi:CubicO group peptidase (beta-lactamase class C family)